MKQFLIVGLLFLSGCAATAGPTITELNQAKVEQYHEEQMDKIEAMRIATARREADQKSFCKRAGGVRVGLTAEGVRKSCWGKPFKVNVTATSAHKQEQWVYGGGQYVYLTDGVVTAVQTSR